MWSRRRRRLLCDKLSHDESWLHILEPDIKAWSGNALLPRVKKFRNMPPTRKVMLVQF
jgi:hypothetical protein